LIGSRGEGWIMTSLLQWGLLIGGLALIAFGLLWDRPGWRGRAALRGEI